MTDEPIFDRLDDAWHGVISHGRQDIEGVRKVWDRLAHHSDAAATPAEAPTGKANAMSFAEIVDRWKADLEADKAKIEAKLEQDLPIVAQYASAAASNPLVEAAMNVVHLSPQYLTDIANAVNAAEAKLAAAKQAEADAQAAQDAAVAAANPPADPAAPADATAMA